jgi:hypothetical protein
VQRTYTILSSVVGHPDFRDAQAAPRAASSRRRIASPLSPYNQVQASLTRQSKKAAGQPRQKNAPDYDLLSQRFGFNDVFES